MGRPRKHAAIHKLNGSYEPFRHDLGADNLTAVGQCVPTRELDENGQRFFATVLAAYPAGVLGSGESEPLTDFAEWVQRRFILARLERESGQLMIREATEITNHYLRYAARFGLTPADKGRVKLSAPPEEANKAAKFFGVTG